ncbi:MAG: NAD(P)H-quinone oxidoreductase [Acetobacteraceae bacterium]
MTLPERMRCIEVREPGGPEVLALSEAPLPVPRADEILIRVQAAGVNRPDLLQRRGVYPPPPGASPLLGLEVAGEVAALGAAVGGWRLGEPVCGLANGGGYAEYCAIPAAQCLPFPAGFGPLEAAALPETCFTVWANLFMMGRLRAGESALIHGGSSGIGTIAIQLAAALGASAYATAGTAEKCAACVKLGARAAIDYRSTDFAAEIARLTGGRGIDVVLDMVGASYLARNLAALARDGRLVVIATQGGAVADGFDLGLVMRQRLTLTGSAMRPRSTAEKGAIAAELRARAWPLLAAGKVRPVIHAVFPLAEAAAAHRALEAGTHVGKIMLAVAS